MDEVDNDTVEITGIRRPDDRKLTLSEEAQIATIERRIMSGAKRVNDVMTLDERRFLEDIGAEAQVRFARRAIKKEKPRTTLADDLLYTKTRTLIDARVNERAKTLLRVAKRFVLTESAAIKIGEAIRAYPEMLVDHGWFARTPFPTCWIELPAPVFHEAIVPGTGTSEQDERVGYLFSGDHVYVGASNAKEQGADFSPLVYHLHTPNTLAEQLEQAETMKVSRMQLDNFYWGKTMSDSLDQRTLRGLRSQHGFSIQCEERFKGKFQGADWLGFSAGEVRNIIGLLLMINQPSGVVRTEDIERRKMMTHRGTRVLMAHSVVTLNLDRRSKPDRLLRKPTGTHASPKWHEVMDHWCNDRTARTKGFSLDDPKTHGRGDHAHVWEKDDEKLIATCTICGGRRWRRQMKDGRGDRSRGTVSQERIISTDTDREMLRERAFA